MDQILVHFSNPEDHSIEFPFPIHQNTIVLAHNTLSKNLIQMGTSQGDRVLLGGLEYMLLEILANGVQNPSARQLSRFCPCFSKWLSCLLMQVSSAKISRKKLIMNLLTTLFYLSKVPSIGFDFLLDFLLNVLWYETKPFLNAVIGLYAFCDRTLTIP